ncbi:DUF4396 domain-containing protein [Bacillus vallismortis]|uniref:DUF4396 domain-containing protein n=1 Tax=Bacillus vallismortis TaxID=72361 RepID=UPI002090E77F|nr:DUF4396 domain-containing protein [Bacillus vallismortis]MCO4851728.1 DUF4396 domain-containing protein [Bacillus vallismortis]
MSTLDVIAYTAILLGVLSFFIILADVVRHPQKMKIMSVVWPIQGLYLGPFAIWFYWTMGRQTKNKQHSQMNTNYGEHAHHHTHKEMNHQNHKHGNKPFYQSVFVSTSHCSSGCTIGDLIGAPLVFLTGLAIAGSTLFADYVVEFILAYLIGVFFQVFSIVPMNKGMSWGKGFIAAIKADTLSLIAFEIGMFGWMAIVHYGIFASNVPKPNDPVFWFMMQIAMILGTATSYPANWFLVKKGVKHAM